MIGDVLGHQGCYKMLSQILYWFYETRVTDAHPNLQYSLDPEMQEMTNYIAFMLPLSFI